MRWSCSGFLHLQSMHSLHVLNGFWHESFGDCWKNEPNSIFRTLICKKNFITFMDCFSVPCDGQFIHESIISIIQEVKCKLNLKRIFLNPISIKIHWRILFSISKFCFRKDLCLLSLNDYIFTSNSNILPFASYIREAIQPQIMNGQVKC